MRCRLLAALAILGLIALVVPAATAGSWTQIGGGPGRTGAIPFDGPRTNDTAFQVELPGTPFIQPVVADGAAYVPTYDAGFGDLDAKAIFRVDLSEGSVEKVMDHPGGEAPIRVRPDHVVYWNLETGELVARDAPSGEEEWRTRPLEDRPIRSLTYAGTATVGDRLYVPFVAWGPSVGLGPVSSGGGTYTGGVMALDLESGEEAWTWTRNPVSEEGIEAPGPASQVSFRNVDGVRVSATGDRVYPYIQLESGYGAGSCTPNEGPCADFDVDRVQYELWALQAQDGDVEWVRNDTDRRSASVYTPVGFREVTAGPLEHEYGRVTGGKAAVSANSVHVRLDAVQRINPATGETLWTSPAGDSDQVQIQGTYGTGVQGDTLVALTPQTITHLDAESGDLAWQRTEPRDDRIFGISGVAVDDDTAYVPTIYLGDAGGPGLQAVDLENGDVLWNERQTSEMSPDGGISITSFPAFGPGVAVLSSKDGRVTVIGETEASLGEPDVTASTAYPDEGENVTVDLSGTEPGAFGPATRYKADWGDGNTTGWQGDPVLTHAYDTAGDQTATFHVGNEEGQTARTTQTFHVGEEPPREPHAVEAAFRENPDAAWGVVGLSVALVGGVAGVARRVHKRSRLQQELDALEEGFEETRSDPGECEAFLDTRKGRARSLALDGKLNEEQAGIVASRAEELRRKLRQDAVEEEFGFLPHELVRKARTMLEDGEVSELEAEAFLAALEEVDFLREEQEALVRERIEDWYGRDAGGGGAG